MNKVKELLAKLKQKVLNLVRALFGSKEKLPQLDVGACSIVDNKPDNVSPPADPVDCVNFEYILRFPKPVKKAKKKSSKKKPKKSNSKKK